MEVNTQDTTTGNQHTSAMWKVHCTVCGHELPGFQCMKASGARGFFYCPYCRSGLEMRGRWISAMILAALVCTLVWFALFFSDLWAHRTIGFVVAYSAEVFLLLLTVFFCLRVIIRVHRRDVDASFVL